MVMLEITSDAAIADLKLLKRWVAPAKGYWDVHQVHVNSVRERKPSDVAKHLRARAAWAKEAQRHRKAWRKARQEKPYTWRASQPTP